MSQVNLEPCGLPQRSEIPPTYGSRRNVSVRGAAAAFRTPNAQHRAAMSAVPKKMGASKPVGMFGEASERSIHASDPIASGAEGMMAHENEMANFIPVSLVSNDLPGGQEMVNFQPNTLTMVGEPIEVRLHGAVSWNPSSIKTGAVELHIKDSDIRRAIERATVINNPDDHLPGGRSMTEDCDFVVCNGSMHVDTDYDGMMGIKWKNAPQYNQKSHGSHNYVDVIGPRHPSGNAATEFDVTPALGSAVYSFLGGKDMQDFMGDEYNPNAGDIGRGKPACTFEVKRDSRLWSLAGHLASAEEFRSANQQLYSAVAGDKVKVPLAMGKAVLDNYKKNYQALIPHPSIERRGITLQFVPLDVPQATISSDKKSKLGAASAAKNENKKSTGTWISNGNGACFGKVNMTLRVAPLSRVPNRDGVYLETPLGGNVSAKN